VLLASAAQGASKLFVALGFIFLLAQSLYTPIYQVLRLNLR